MNKEDRELLEDGTITEGRAMDYTMVYLIARRLTKPIKEFDAYEMGIIDEDGHKIRDPETSEEKDAYTIFDRLILRIRHLVGNHKVATLTVAFLLAEETKSDGANVGEEELIEHYRRKNKAEEIYDDLKNNLREEEISETEFWNHLLRTKIGDSNE